MAVYFVHKVILDDFLFFFYFLFLHMGIFALENMCNSNESESLLFGICFFCLQQKGELWGGGGRMESLGEVERLLRG